MAKRNIGKSAEIIVVRQSLIAFKNRKPQEVITKVYSWGAVFKPINGEFRGRKWFAEKLAQAVKITTVSLGLLN